MSNFASYPSLKGKVAVVTGGASGIGAAIAEQLTDQRCSVAIIDIDDNAGRSLESKIVLGGATAMYVSCDLRDADALGTAIAGVSARLGPISALVNNGARDDRHALESVTPAYWDERFAVNFRHQFFASQAVAADMKSMRAGSIVNFGSTSWMKAMGTMPAYEAAKAAVHGLTRSLARSLGGHGVRVNCIVPGWIMTERQQKLWLTPESEAELLRSQCLKEKLYPADVARMVLWLLADDSRMVTGQDFVVDGGWF